jgi:transposase
MTRIWAYKGTRPRVIRQQQYEYVYLFGAVCPSSGKTIGLVLPVLNTQAMHMHLQCIAEQLEPGKHAVVVLDRATWHTTQKLKQFTNISLLPLPPVSPELNPVEQVWQYLRDKYLANRSFKNYRDIMNACCKSWNAFGNEESTVKNLCKRDWALLCN